MKIRFPASADLPGHLVLSLALFAYACAGGDTASTLGAGGSTASGSSSGGATTLGGASSVAGAGGGLVGAGGTLSGLGGTLSTGATQATGGAMTTGGVKASGGTVAATGGAKATGGAIGTGGTKSTGGMPATGGIATGGVKATGGVPATGGAKATGGMPATGGAKATGGATATSCSFPSAWNPGSPTYTTYTLPNAQTACGYNGSNNRIANIVNGANFAAIPGNSSSDFNTSNRCGACVQIGSAIITIVDECPFPGNTPCQNNPTGHLDLSQAAASAAGVQGDPNLRNQAAWKFIPCPVTGNVIVRLKSGNNNEFYIENEILPIQSVTCGSQTGSRTSYGAWHFAANVNGQSCSATDIGGRSITFTVGNSQGQDVDTGTQFPKCN